MAISFNYFCMKYMLFIVAIIRVAPDIVVRGKEVRVRVRILCHIRLRRGVEVTVQINYQVNFGRMIDWKQRGKISHCKSSISTGLM